MTKRKPGWYHVDYGQGWTCDYYDGHVWNAMDDLMPGRSTGMSPLRIGPRIPAPDEPWQCVPREMTSDMRESMGNTLCGIMEIFGEAYGDILEASPKPEDTE